MTKETTKSKVWTKPQMKRLGEIRDVAQNPGAGPQGVGDKT